MLIYKIIMSLHVIAIICWMAGILYLFRLFVYHSAETEEVVMKRFRIMEQRLWSFITLPAMLVALIAGIVMLTLNFDLFKAPWMHAKLLFVVMMIGITHAGGSLVKKFENGKPNRSEKYFRIMNEVPTILMILIVALVIIKPFV